MAEWLLSRVRRPKADRPLAAPNKTSSRLLPKCQPSNIWPPIAGKLLTSTSPSSGRRPVLFNFYIGRILLEAACRRKARPCPQPGATHPIGPGRGRYQTFTQKLCPVTKPRRMRTRGRKGEFSHGWRPRTGSAYAGRSKSKDQPMDPRSERARLTDWSALLLLLYVRSETRRFL